MSLQIASIRNIPIKLHFTLIIVFFLISWTLSSSFMPSLFPRLPDPYYWIMGISGAIILFSSVLLHELAHSLLSLRYGLNVRQIILFIFGGVSDIKEEPKEYQKEFKIAVVGPLTSFALAAALVLVWSLLLFTAGEPAFPTIATFQDNDTVQISNDLNFIIVRAISGILFYATAVNFLIGLFNLLPAFPLDGGRMLRAGLMKWNRSYDQATRTAVKVGVGISYALMAFGFITILTGSFIAGIWLILIGWFLQSGAQAYLQQHELTAALSQVRLKDIMNTRFISINPDQSVGEALRDYFNQYRKSEFPVIDYHGYLVGTITSQHIMKFTGDMENSKVRDVMTPAKELVIMDPYRCADEALKRMSSENKSRVFVCDGGYSFNVNPPTAEDMSENNFPDSVANRRLVGIISKTDILNIAAEWREFSKSMKDVEYKR